jgi:hypothetical protein
VALAEGAKLVRVPLSGEGFSGLITQLRVDPLGTTTAQLSVRRIRLVKT